MENLLPALPIQPLAPYRAMAGGRQAVEQHIRADVAEQAGALNYGGGVKAIFPLAEAMLKYLSLLILVLLFGCAKSHYIKRADLDYINITRESGTSIYKLNFSSNISLLSIFRRDQAPLRGMFRCSLEHNEAPRSSGVDKYIAEGLIETEELKPEKSIFIFSSELMFFESLNEGRSDRILEEAELRKILSTKQAIPCIYRTSAYFFKPYYSNTLWIPTADIIREIDR